MMMVSNLLCGVLVALVMTTIALEVPCSFQSQNFPTYFMGLKESSAFLPFIVTNTEDRFRLVSPGLTGQEGTVSFESEKHPGHYLRHSGFLLYLRQFEESDVYARDATFWPRKNHFGYLGFDSYESENYPNHFIRHQGYRLKISMNDNSAVFKKDASFKKACSPFHRRSDPAIFMSRNYPNLQWGFNNKGLPFIVARKPHQSFKIVSPGLTGESGTVSFESETFPGYYLRHSEFDLYLHPFKQEKLYRKDTTFIQTSLLSGHVAYRSQNYPNHYIRHQGFRLKISDYSGTISTLMRNDASFKVMTETPLQISKHSLVSKNYPYHSVGTSQDGSVRLIPAISDSQYALLSPGLNGIAGTWSIVNRRYPAHYLRHKLPLQDERMYYAEFSDLTTDDKKDAATYLKLDNHFFEGYTVFVSYNSGNRRFIRHQGFYLKSSLYDNPSTLEQNDASFWIY